MDDGRAERPSPVPTVANSPLSLAQSCWFTAAAILGVVYLFVLPPYQGADEPTHWLRSWSVAEGQVRCGALPEAAVSAWRPFRLEVRDKASLGAIEAALQREPPTGTTDTYYRVQACAYPPYPYFIPAAVLRVVAYGDDGRIGRGDVIKAFYAVRVVNWFCLCVVVLWFLRRLPRFRNVTLFFFSIPEVFEQASQFNTDLAQFVLMLVMLVIVLRRPSWWRVGAVGLVAILMTMIKPVFGLLGLMALPALIELRATRGGSVARYLLVGLLLLLLPLAFWKIWTDYANVEHHFASGVDPELQLAFLLDHPLHVFEVFWNQLRDTFGHDLMQGSWTSILGGFGRARVELPMLACYLLLFALALAAYADFGFTEKTQPVTPRTGQTRLGRFAWLVAAASAAAAIPASILAMYLFYTRVGSDVIRGVQGRYYLVPLFMLLVFGMHLAHRRLGERRAPGTAPVVWLAGILCAWAGVIAIDAVAQSYWSPP